MSVKQSGYEALLSRYSNPNEAISLIQQYRPYLQLLPSAKQSSQSVLVIPLPTLRISNFSSLTAGSNLSPKSQHTIILPCDLAILTCDPEWKIKMAEEILIFIHRPQEDFSDLLGRWRQTQVWLDKDYEWIMPKTETDMLSEGSNNIYPLFVLFETTLERIKRGLAGANLPFVVQIDQQLENSFEEMPLILAREE
ncbi:MAG: hypothetical protein QNJ38_02140 [Prochloraceae cyanobacterium]|nr:hypothetical protein [Prochloraceae cyanobacterium]